MYDLDLQNIEVSKFMGDAMIFLLKVNVLSFQSALTSLYAIPQEHKQVSLFF